MALDDYKVETDHFEAFSLSSNGYFRSDFAFPCNVCCHNDKNAKQAPCRNCGHNANAETETADPAPASSGCGCLRCTRESGRNVNGLPEEMTRMIACPRCGNKRCPHASDHRNACTNSNEPGQIGSVYGPNKEIS